MSDDLNPFIRQEWLSFLKWTAGLSVFLITALLTILTLKDEVTQLRNFTCFTKSALTITVGTLFINIIAIWILHRYSIYKFYPKYNLLLKKEKIADEDQVEFNKMKSFVRVWELIILIFFGIGLASFIAFIFSYLLKP